VRITQIFYYPKNVGEAKTNLEKAVYVLNERAPELSADYVIDVERILRGDHEIIWGALWTLLRFYPLIQTIEAIDIKSELPYGIAEIKRLETNLLIWMHGLGITGLPQCPIDINQIMQDLKSGVVLADLINRIFPVAISGIFRKPRTENTCLSNVRKCMEILRKSSRMSQKFVWREKEIVQGNVAVLLGILEDLHRYADGLKARKRGPGYHNDGPYIGRSDPGRSISAPITSKAREYDQTFSAVSPTLSIKPTPLRQLRASRSRGFVGEGIAIESPTH
jgi:hypothetical protein